MKTILNRLSGEHNIGSVARLLFIPTIYVNSIPFPDANGRIKLSDFVFRSVGISWYNAEFVMDSIEHKQEAKEEDSGILYIDTITWQVAKDYDSRQMDFGEMMRYEFFVVCIDNNGYGKLLGYFESTGEKKGCKFDWDRTTSRKRSDLNGYNLKFVLQGPFPPQNITDVTAAPIDNGSGIITPAPPQT